MSVDQEMEQANASLSECAKQARLVTMDSNDFATSDSDQLRPTIGMWAEEHGIWTWLLPIHWRESDPIELGIEIADYIDATIKTQRTFTRNDIGLGREDANATEYLLRMHKAVLDEVGTNRRRYYNPEYIHYDHCITPITDRAEQLEFYNKFIPLGVVSPEWVLKHFELTTDGVTPVWGMKHLEYNRAVLNVFVDAYTQYSSVEEHLEEARKEFARTAFTILAWGEWELSEIAKATNISPTTLSQWIHNYAVGTGWNPPKRPIEQNWSSRLARPK